MTPAVRRRLGRRIRAEVRARLVELALRGFGDDPPLIPVRDGREFFATWRRAGELVAEWRNRNEHYLYYYYSGLARSAERRLVGTQP